MIVCLVEIHEKSYIKNVTFRNCSKEEALDK